MEFLTSLFGNLTNGIIRLAVTVGILAAVYFFIVKPVLHTTEHSIDTTNKAFEKSFNSSTFDTKKIEAEVHKSLEDANKQVKSSVEKSFHSTKVNGTQRKQEKLLRCIQRAHQNVHRIERCSRRFAP